MNQLKIALASASLIAIVGCGGQQDDAGAAPEPTPQPQATPAPTSGAPAPVDVAEAAPEGGPPNSYRQCAVCHAVSDDAPPGIGPHLAGIYGAPSARFDDFAYSNALSEANLVWDDATLDQFIQNPQALVPGNRMAFVGVRSAEARQEIIDYLKTLTEE